ncbi:hypothetical protein [Actinoplanes teichomyceticus]|uniref:Uncharacterized protein n=1 Tax=Actinoplanes teichomyceticus TaxID=1867 RepID=A0A561WKX5_ACTTI|nr:hypothetical protein [Actinoplanes teichomyceticus]TWG24514.1 hypothetical protein FHX34_1021074 [Actinoplanes teichomyceticus]GIF16810.1 hypothetical protein Ate01nite_68420 [Actinoplanes teichomyceticus]
MTVARYAARTAVFAAAYLLVHWVGTLLPGFSPLAVAAVWLLAQGRWGLRRFDVITLGTVTAVSATVAGAGLLLSLALAATVTLPALLFATLVERRLPGWWQGHGDRFRPRRDRVGRLAAVAALSAAACLVLRAVTATGLSGSGLVLAALCDTATILLLTLAGRALRRSRGPRAGGVLSVAPATVAPLSRTQGRGRR